MRTLAQPAAREQSPTIDARDATTQRSRILQLLLAANGAEVPAPELAGIALQYASRVHELREEGWPIRNRVEMVGKAKHGFFSLHQAAVPAEVEAEVRGSAARITHYTPRPTPFDLPGLGTIVDTHKFVSTTLTQLTASLHAGAATWQSGNWRAAVLIARLQACGVHVEIEP